MHTNELIVEFIIRGRVREKRVTIRDKQVEYSHHLQHKEDRILIAIIRGSLESRHSLSELNVAASSLYLMLSCRLNVY